MSPDILTVATGVALLALILSALILCLVMTRALFKLYPDIRRIVANLESTTASAAVATENIAAASEKAPETMASAAVAAENIAAATENARETLASTAQATGNIAAASSLLGPAGTVANVLKAGKDLLTDEQWRELVSGIKGKFQAIDAKVSVDSITGKIGDLLRQRRGR